MKKILLCFFLVSFTKTFACLNGETKVLKDGTLVYEDYEGVVPNGHHFFSMNLEQTKKSLDSLYQKTKNIDYLSDIGYVLIIQKKYNEALKLYLEIEKKYPNRYSTASNIGTLYELIGDNKNALFWIKKSIEINPNSHQNSEWLHVKILEAKINNPQTLDGNYFFDADFGKKIIPVTLLSDKKVEELIDALYFQLNERRTFIKNKDQIMASLFFELGNLCQINKDFYSANQIFKIAKEYGLNDEILNQRIAFTEGVLYERRNQPNNNYHRKKPVKMVYNIEKTILLILSIISGLTIIFFLYKKSKK